MAINLDSLALRTGDTGFIFSPDGGVVATMGYQVFHVNLGEVLTSGTVSQRVGSIPRVEGVGSDLLSQAHSRFVSYIERHRAIPVIFGYSAHDADLILDGWWFFEQGDGLYTLDHPVCGNHPGIDVDPSSFVSSVNTILSLVPPPPVWFWAESVIPGTLRVKCVSVVGATGYNVYVDGVLLGSVPSSDWQTLNIDPGSYSVQMAAVGGGQVGILSFPVGVTVLGASSMALAYDAVSTPRGTQPQKQPRALFRWWQGVKRWLYYA